MAFSYVKTKDDKVGKVNKVWGTWSATTGSTTGVISFGPINGLSISELLMANAISSTSVTTMTAAKLVVGTATTQATIALTHVDSDKGFWSAEWL